MLFLQNFAQAVGFLAAISIVFIPLEHFWAPPGSPKSQREWLNDAIFYFGQALVFNALTIGVLTWIFSFIELSVNLPTWFKIVLAIIGGDFLIYWGHRAQHTIPVLWRFHRVHHTAQHVDYLAAYREHPLDNIYTRGLETLPAVLLGLDLNLIAGFIMFRGLWALFIHSNVSLRLGWLEVLLGSPHLHHWHHELEKRGLVNYANLSPVMDIAFGTYFNPPELSARFGITEPVRQGWFWQMVDPLLR